MNYLFDNILHIAGIVLGSSAISATITAYFARKKMTAQSEAIEADADVNVAKSAMDYAKMVETSLRSEINHMITKNIELEKKIDHLTSENMALHRKVYELKSELDRYENK